MAKVIICDICERPIRDRQYKIKIKKEMFSFTKSWFEKIDICEECADRIIMGVKRR